MRLTHKRCMAAAALLSLLTVPTTAFGMRIVEKAIEGAELHIDPGPPARVRALGCSSCPRTFRLAEDYRLKVGGQLIPREEWHAHQGEVGTLIYNVESGRAVRLLW